MASWHLSFVHPSSVTLEACQQLLATFVGGDVTPHVGELTGNPRDYYARAITIRGERDEVGLELTASQGLRDARDPEPIISGVAVALTSRTATFATKLATWRALGAAFAGAGFRESTLVRAAAIVDDADAAGDAVTAAQLRRDILAALVEQAARCARVDIASPRVDVEPILRAYQRPEGMGALSLSDCGLTALPSGLALFPNLTELALEEDAFDGSVLHGVALPRLARLTLRGQALRRVTRADLAGCPALEVLLLARSSLEALDPAIIEGCPGLTRVDVTDSPLHGDAAAMTELRARWPGVLWPGDDHAAAARVASRRRSARKRRAPAAAPAVVHGEIRPAAPRGERAPFVDGVLTLAAPGDTIEDVRALIATGAHQGAVTLVIGHTSIGDAVLALIARARAYPAVTTLRVGGAGVTDAGVHALATRVVGLDALGEVHLGDAPGGRASSGISDAAVAALASSPRLPALARIIRSIEHHVYAADARAGTVVTEVRRDDGRVVQCVVEHDLWP